MFERAKEISDRFKNPDGTYNVAEALAAASGLSKKEITWTWKRMKHLRQVEGKSSEEAKRIIMEEGKLKPWE